MSLATAQAGRFRRLIGTMSPPDDSDEAEIYVEVRRLLSGIILVDIVFIILQS